MQYNLGAMDINQIFCAVSHAAVEALADQWKTRKIAWYLAHRQAPRVLSSESVLEGDRPGPGPGTRRGAEDGAVLLGLPLMFGERTGRKRGVGAL